jgi:two-component system nitrate/nitrite response regulator NarL
MAPSMAVRVVVADRLPVFRYGLKRLLDSTRHLRMVGEAEHPAEAVEAVRRLDPDVLVLSFEPDEDGLHVMRALAASASRVRCVVLTNRDECPPSLASAHPSIGCVLPRTSTGRDLLHCIECVVRHQCWPVPEGAKECRRVATAEAPLQAQAQAEPRGRRYGLTQRETQIVAAVAEGGTNKDIASLLTISEDTVKHHMSNIFDKVGVHTRLELAVFALYHRVVETGAEQRD